MTDKPKESKTIKFDKCPGMKSDGTPCGSSKWLAETLAEEMKERGLMKPEIENYVHVLPAIVVDQSRAKYLPVGIKVPAYTIHTDVCMECGTYCVRRIDIAEAQLGAANMPPHPPGMGAEPA